MWYLTGVIALFLVESVLGYKAAIVEYNPVSAQTPSDTILKNLEQYRGHVQSAKTQGADIVVFPEYGLTTMVANPEGYAIEISPDHSLVHSLSTIASENRLYLVINLLEKVGTKSVKYYNTNLVFDRTGQVLVKYRKINLFGEPNLAAGSKDQKPTFETDFGVTFATFTCFDILFVNPSRTILKENITDIAYPTSWFTTLPFYASLSVQHGYAASTGVNLLAANVDEPVNTHGGSGIYLADGTARIYIGDEPRSEVIVKEVPKRTKKKEKNICRTTVPLVKAQSSLPSNLSNYQTLRDFKAADYTFQDVDLNQDRVTTSVCHERFCCNFSLSVDSLAPGDIYKVMAYDGIVPFDVSTAHVRFCSLLACQNGTKDSCGGRTQTGTKFSKITITGNLEKTSSTFYTPLTLNSYLQPLTDTVYCELDKGNGTPLVQLTSLQPLENVIVYGLFGKVDS